MPKNRAAPAGGAAIQPVARLTSCAGSPGKPTAAASLAQGVRLGTTGPSIRGCTIKRAISLTRLCGSAYTDRTSRGPVRKLHAAKGMVGPERGGGGASASCKGNFVIRERPDMPNSTNISNSTKNPLCSISDVARTLYCWKVAA